jgi:hypothetical protein
MQGEYDPNQIEPKSLVQLHHIRIASAKYILQIMDKNWLPSCLHGFFQPILGKCQKNAPQQFIAISAHIHM